jgi:hypothetical protein
MALVLYCNDSSPVKIETAGIVSEVGLTGCPKNFLFIVLKADIAELHQVEYWNKQLVLVPDVHIVQGPQGVIPSLVGFYDIHNDISNGKSARVVGKTLLFQSAIYGYYKFLPPLADWKPRAMVGNSCSLVHSLKVENIERTSEVVERVSDDKSRVNGRECGPVNINMDPIYPVVFLDANGVKIRSSEGNQEFIQVMDVFHGPFNLIP